VTGTTPPEETLPLRDRFPDYLAVFGVGWVAIVVVGTAIGLLTSATVIEGISYVAMASSVVLLLAGGASGGGYTSLGLGAAGALFGARQRHDEDYDDPDVRRGELKRINARERLRRGLRPEKNPRAFWQVLAGFVNLAVGLGLLMLFGG
jgi:hypothetical protein